MSNIKVESLDLKKLSFYLKHIEKSFDDEDLIKDILSYIIPKNEEKLAVNIEFDKNSYNTEVAAFDPVFNTINVRISEITKYLELQYQDLSNNLKFNQDSFKAYLLLNVLLHEVEHSKQYMITLNKIDAPYQIVKAGYNICFNTLLTTPKISLIKRKQFYTDRERVIKYMENKDSYLLERNATLESSYILRSLAQYECDDIAYKVLDFIYRSQCYTGYEETGKGAIEKTFRELLYLDMYKTYGYDNPNYEDKIRYGFELSNEELKQFRLECKKTKDRMFS